MFAALAFVALNAAAGDIDAILGPEPNLPIPVRQIAMNQADPQSRYVEESLKGPGISVEGLPSFGFRNFKLMGDGLTANLPWVSSIGGQLRMKGTAWRAGGSAFLSTYTGLPSTISPSQVRSTSWDLQGEGRVLALGRFEFFLGYDVFARTAEATSPQPIVTSFLAQGPRVAARGEWELGTWTFTGDFAVTVPWYYLEEGSVSGSYRFGIRSKGLALIRKNIVGGLSVGAGVEILFQIFNFSGTGSRGTLNATELQLGASVPLLLNYEF